MKRTALIITTIIISGCNNQHTEFQKMREIVNSSEDTAFEETNNNGDDIKNGDDSAEENEKNNVIDDKEERSYKTIINKFTQNESKQSKLDILWVVDNSGSMKEEQNGLANNFNIFINDFVTRNIDFQMGITTTDSRKKYSGKAIGDFSLLNSSAAKNDVTSFIEYFMDKIIVGTKGSTVEKGFDSMKKFIENNGESWMRKDAYLIVIILSDEEDKSREAVSSYVDYLSSLKENPRLIRINSIVNLKKGKNYGKRYIEASQATNGVVAGITEHFSDILQNMSNNIVKLVSSFPLSHAPYDEDIQVSVNNVRVYYGWEYTESSNSITFDDENIPLSNAKIEITYKTKL